MAIKSTSNEKQKALETALLNIEKQYGKGSIMRLGENSAMNIEAISTGSLSLDLALGIGGVPKGRVIEIYGPESSGKTTIALHVVAEVQKKGGTAAFIDVEHALDPEYSQALRKLTACISKSNCAVIFINQLREKIGVMYGNPEVTTGGKALKFYASVRIDIRRIETLKVQGEMVGSRTRAKIVKNKVAPPFKEAEFDIMYGEGISRESELIDLGVKAEVVKKSGAWFSYNDQKIGQGRDNAKIFLMQNPDIAKEIEEKIIENREKIIATRKIKLTADTVKAAEEKEEAAAEAPKMPKIDIDIAVDEQ